MQRPWAILLEGVIGMEFPKGGLIGKTVHTARKIRSLQIPLHGASTGYFLVLSVFPGLLLILGLLRYTGLDVDHFAGFLGDLLPEALAEGAEELLFSAWQHSSGAVVSISAVTALWSASRGIYGLLTGLNAVYGLEENRGYFRTRAISMLYTFVFLLVLLLTLVLHVFGNSLLEILRMVDDPVVIFLTDHLNLRFFLLLGVQTLVFTLIFMVLPNRRSRFRDSLPGGLFASVGWLLFSEGFSLYVRHFPRYANVYGSVYTVALTLLWLYCCMSILFYGGALNRYWMQR